MTLLRHAAVLFVLLAAGCAPRSVQQLYVPLGAGAGYGYAEQTAGDRRFQISYVAPIQTAFTFAGAGGRNETETELARAFDLALLRAAEVAGANNAPAFRVVERLNDVNVRNYPSYRDPFWYPGRHRPYHPFGWPYGPYAYDESYAALATRVTLTIELAQAVEPGVYDAQNVRSTVRARYAMPAA